MSGHSDNTPLRTRLRCWFAGPAGTMLLQTERAALRQSLANLFGYHILQLGRLGGGELLESARISHRVQIALAGDCDEVAGVGLRCDAASLPVATASVDVVVLAHVLEFEIDPHQVLREVDRVLIGEGHVLVIGFNPFSLWGVWRSLLAWRGEPPWCGRFFGAARIRDWLRLLGCDIVSTRGVCFRPPLGSAAALRRLAFLEKLGAYVWPGCGAAFCIVAKKRLVPMTPIRTRWTMRRNLIAAGLAEPSTRNSTEH
ncbi:MAG: class I SAM-dependent methyltransferase [Gammaproteobacteria bacterium]|nr:class I SAM-dependent methyltransferase [Gammaproteobacteria bacterium]